MVFKDGRSIRSVARRLKCSEDTVKEIVRRYNAGERGEFQFAVSD